LCIRLGVGRKANRAQQQHERAGRRHGGAQARRTTFCRRSSGGGRSWRKKAGREGVRTEWPWVTSPKIFLRRTAGWKGRSVDGVRLHSLSFADDER
jgi:hypothetical protein